ncbi:MAG: Asp-tRNA(Asn)/Glu-tRNA(Gln) amidotransferase subunit GatC [Anaerolineae bacterium]|nr:Asp-tRNA(Asn)/Glu-tRNA(Gln) amidotransferase subunit GatC [Anaerolineae bacterium]
MSLTREEVEHIAQLARLHLSDEEKERYRKQLSSILDHVAKLQDLDTSGVSARSSVLAQRSRLREDVPGDGLSPKELLENAPAAEAGQFRVPPVLDGQAG